MHEIFQNNWTNPWKTVNFPETTLTKTDLDLTIPQDAYAIPEAPQKYAGIDFDAIDYLTPTTVSIKPAQHSSRKMDTSQKKHAQE